MSTTSPSYRVFAQSIGDTVRIYWRVFRSACLWLIPLHLVDSGANRFFDAATNKLQDMGREDIFSLSSIAVLELVFTAVWSALWLIILAKAVNHAIESETPLAPAPVGPDPAEAGFPATLNQVLIEEVRAMASVLWRLPLLIVPAITQYMRLTLVPLVVILDPDYRRGRLDALQQSRKLSHGQFWLLTITVVASTAIPWLVENYAQGDAVSLWARPRWAIPCLVFTFFINVATSTFLVSLYTRLARTRELESA